MRPKDKTRPTLSASDRAHQKLMADDAACNLRIKAMHFALHNKPSFSADVAATKKQKEPKFNLISEAKRIFTYLKTGK